MFGVLSVLAVAWVCVGIPPEQRTADMPDSWLVLYNVNVPASVTWANWYAGQWGIPSEQLLGLDASSDEHLATAAEAEAQVFAPVNDFLAANPEIEGRLMGILVGYRVPGHYEDPPAGGTGGISIAGCLQWPADNNWYPWPPYNPDNPRLEGYLLPRGGRLTKASLSAGHYLTARIDGLSLAMAQAYTVRTKAIMAQASVLSGYHVYYDTTDPTYGEWYWLEQAVDSSYLADLRWLAFDSDTEQTPNDAFRFGWHDVDGWSDTRLRGSPAGPRVLAYNLNSWGATTVRSLTAGNGGRYVPNAIDAGYAAAIGATGEPGSTVGVLVDTLLVGMRHGWTLGESCYLANPFDNWMWTLFGDPFLIVPDWENGIPGNGDLDGDGDADGHDFLTFQNCYNGSLRPPRPGCMNLKADMDSDGDVDGPDFMSFCVCVNGAYRPPACHD